MPHLETLYKRFKGAGFAVLGVNADNDTKENIESIVGSFKLTYPMLMNGNAVAFESYNMSRFPTTILIDRSGNIAHRELSFHGIAPLEARIRELLSK